MKYYILAIFSFALLLEFHVNAEVTSSRTEQEMKVQVLAKLELLAIQETRLAAAQESIYLLIQREREEERRLCMNKWKGSTFAKVWPLSSWAKKDGRTWEELTNEEKAFFQHLCIEKYINKKIPELNLPKLTIPEREYSEAWKIINLHAPDAVKWEKVPDFNLKSQFRKEYHDYKLSLVGGPHFPMQLRKQEQPLFASILSSHSLVIL